MLLIILIFLAYTSSVLSVFSELMISAQLSFCITLTIYWNGSFLGTISSFYSRFWMELFISRHCLLCNEQQYSWERGGGGKSLFRESRNFWKSAKLKRLGGPNVDALYQHHWTLSDSCPGLIPVWPTSFQFPVASCKMLPLIHIHNGCHKPESFSSTEMHVKPLSKESSAWLGGRSALSRCLPSETAFTVQQAKKAKEEGGFIALILITVIKPPTDAPGCGSLWRKAGLRARCAALRPSASRPRRHRHGRHCPGEGRAAGPRSLPAPPVQVN